ncbi:glycerophosphoryl diester phosphodiesterase membrane domain-containing protein [Gordonia soli]|uniref:glycerophosphoryl diester phosphodiesterase membrane domain-containing protein n=1 Tax=Gordonia soli TaxID=320799 RepID=UPI00034B2C88|nr:glycerophosphoryl diester phosphodiesterase membrane domain-containing protein [Gordonia soli]
MPGPAWGVGGPSAPPFGHANPLVAHKPGTIPLRPLNLGDILQAAFTAVRRNASVYFGLTLVTWLVFLFVAGAIGAVAFLAVSATGADELAIVATVAIGFLGFSVLSGVVTAALSGVLAYPVNQGAVGRSTTVGETWARTKYSVPRLVGLYLLLGLATSLVIGLPVTATVWAFSAQQPVLGVLALVLTVAIGIGVVWLGVRLALALPAVVVEELGVVDAIRRSYALTSGLFWRTFATLLVIAILTGIVQYVISFLFQILGYLLIAVGHAAGGATAITIVAAAVMIIGTVLSSVVTQPFIAIALALVHIDARIRAEGFDITLGQAAAEVAAGAHADGWMPREPSPGSVPR